MDTTAIHIENLSKRYEIGTSTPAHNRLTEALWEGVRRAIARGAPTARPEPVDTEFWALKDVNIDVAQGEVLGVVGRNGAGKSTLLKILSRVTQPTEGYAELNGHVGALLEVGTGFHPELTGRENISLNGGILGMSRAEIRENFDDIVEFAGIGRFIDTPVKRYSSGMFVRLAFAVAAHLEPQILIIDEVLAVGDVAFQAKCLGKMEDVARGGRTVLFVSHNMGAVKSLCSRAVTLDGGRIVCDSSPDEAIAEYLSRMTGGSSSHAVIEERDDVPVQVLEMAVEDEHGRPGDAVELGRDCTLVARYAIRERRRNVSIALLVSREGVPLLYSYDTDADPLLRGDRPPGEYEIRVPLPTSLFKEGSYELALKVGAGNENLTDDDATIALRIVNHDLDLTHRSYRGDRPGLLYRELSWQTELLSRG
jgi:lipopolysaccharide transport system ATP-binding protein